MAASSDGATLMCAAGDSIVEVSVADGAIQNRWSPGVCSSHEALTTMAVSPGTWKISSGFSAIKRMMHAARGETRLQLMSHLSYATPLTWRLQRGAPCGKSIHTSDILMPPRAGPGHIRSGSCYRHSLTLPRAQMGCACCYAHKTAASRSLT